MDGILQRLKAGLWYAPAAILVLLIFVYPILRTVILSFLHLELATGFQPEFAGLANFARLASDSRFWGSLKVTSLFTVVSVSLEFLIGLLLALAVERLGRGCRPARTFFLFRAPTAIIAVL
jgi:multiple sugar transport system permease protein